MEGGVPFPFKPLATPVDEVSSQKYARWCWPQARAARTKYVKMSRSVSVSVLGSELELELELIQTHMTQKPMLRVVGARVCAQVKNM
jgi:hypothetical protein